MMSLLDKFDGELQKDGVSDFRPGDTVKVHVRIVEGEKERIQIFQGVVIRKRGRGRGASFTVRKVSYGVGVERIFPFHSPNVAQVEVVQHGRVRRARLYYLRKLRGKKARIRAKRVGFAEPEMIVPEDEAPPAEPAPEAAAQAGEAAPEPQAEGAPAEKPAEK